MYRFCLDAILGLQIIQDNLGIVHILEETLSDFRENLKIHAFLVTRKVLIMYASYVNVMSIKVFMLMNWNVLCEVKDMQ